MLKLFYLGTTAGHSVRHINRNSSSLVQWTSPKCSGSIPDNWVCVESLSTIDVDNGLIHVLAERWWDTTHTFWIENVREMTMTPKDFSFITGVPVDYHHIKLCSHVHNNVEFRRKLMGEEFMYWSSERVLILWIYETYRHRKCIDDASTDIVVRAFMLFLVGSVLFVDSDAHASLKLLPLLENISCISKYNWGATALANLYHEMDDLCRGVRDIVGGLSYAWEVYNQFIKIFWIVVHTTIKLHCSTSYQY